LIYLPEVENSGHPADRLAGNFKIPQKDVYKTPKVFKTMGVWTSLKIVFLYYVGSAAHPQNNPY